MRKFSGYRCGISFLGIIALSLGLVAPGFAAPRIFFTDITSGPNTGGEGGKGAYLTIFGKGFGAVRGTSAVTIGGGEVGRYMVWSDEKVSVQLGANAASGAIKLITANGNATARDIFTVRPGNFYFIALNGSDSTGVKNDINHPFRTPNGVNSKLVPGDFMVVRGGTYDLGDGSNNVSYSSWWRVNLSGTPGNPLTFMGYPGEDVIALMKSPIMLVGTSSTVSVSNIVVGDFKVSLNHCQPGNVAAIGTPRLADTACNGIVKATDVRLVNFDIDGHDVGGLCSGWGDNIIEIGYSDRVKVLGMAIHNTSPAQANEGSHLIYLSSTQSGSEVGWNHVYNIPSSRATIQVHTDNVGSNCYGQKKLTDITIHDNHLHNIAGQAILLDGGTGDITVYNNLIHNAPVPSGNTYEDVIALRGSGGRLNAKLYNNTVYVNPWASNAGWVIGSGSVIGDGCPEALTFYNNIFYVMEAQDVYFHPQTACAGSPVTSNNNVWYGSASAMPAFAGTGDISVDPLFVDTSVANFQLTKTTTQASPAIDKGFSNPSINSAVTTDFNGNPRPQGAGYDIGAFESAGVTLPKPLNIQLRKK